MMKLIKAFGILPEGTETVVVDTFGNLLYDSNDPENRFLYFFPTSVCPVCTIT